VDFIQSADEDITSKTEISGGEILFQDCNIEILPVSSLPDSSLGFKIANSHSYCTHTYYWLCFSEELTDAKSTSIRRRMMKCVSPS
jgi:hypothetical protein